MAANHAKKKLPIVGLVGACITLLVIVLALILGLAMGWVDKFTKLWDLCWQGLGKMGSMKSQFCIWFTTLGIFLVGLVTLIIFISKKKHLSTISPICLILDSMAWVGACEMTYYSWKGTIGSRAMPVGILLMILVFIAGVCSLVQIILDLIKAFKKEEQVGLTYDEVADIAERELANSDTVEEPDEEKPAEEEAPAEETKEEPVVEEVVIEKVVIKEVVEEPAAKKEPADASRFEGLSAKKRPAFEDKVADADNELRAMYEGIRDHIAAYGIKERLSIPGATYSAHRERLVFLTVSGKHLRINFALNPADYVNSTIPVTPNHSKKFSDLPITLNVRSGLSYRRALTLVDDVMVGHGYHKQDE